jgi:hypothetical protein
MKNNLFFYSFLILMWRNIPRRCRGVLGKKSEAVQIGYLPQHHYYIISG